MLSYRRSVVIAIALVALAYAVPARAQAHQGERFVASRALQRDVH